MGEEMVSDGRIGKYNSPQPSLNLREGESASPLKLRGGRGSYDSLNSPPWLRRGRGGWLLFLLLSLLIILFTHIPSAFAADTLQQPPPPCTPTICNAPEPACDQTTYGTDNCGGPCSKTGPACPPPPCTPFICNAPDPACDQTTYGTDNCGGSCSKTGPACPPPPCTPFICNAPDPACDQTTYGTDNCGGPCSKTGPACPPSSCTSTTCNAPEPACGQTTYGTDNCGSSCSKTGSTCPVSPPIVNDVPSTTTSQTITLSGTKQAGTAIYINGVEYVSVNGSITWEATYTLQHGTNTLNITAKDVNGNQSQTVVIEITYACPAINSFEVCSGTVFDPLSGGYISFGYSVYLAGNDEEIVIKTKDGELTVKTLYNYTSAWDGKTDNGKLVLPGRYTATMTVRKTGCSDATSTESFSIEPIGLALFYINFASSASVTSGNLYHSQTLFTIPNSKILGDFTLSYNSLDSYSGPLATGWTHAYNINLSENNNNSYTVMQGDGKREVLYQNGDSYIPKTSTYPILTKNTDGTYTLTYIDGTIYNFDSNGKITSITDRNSNTLTFSYDSNNNLTNITDPSGRVITLSYDSDNRINTITDPNGNTHGFTYTNNTLTGISTMSYELIAKSWSFTYDQNAFMLTRTDPAGNTTKYSYDENHRVLTGTDTEGKTKSIAYPEGTDAVKTTTVTEKDGGNWTYTYDTSQGILTEKGDPEDNTTAYSYDSNKNITATTEPNGGVTSYTYDSDNNMTSVTDAESNVTTYTYNTYGQVTGITDSEGKSTTYEYDSKGNLTSTTDPSGAKTQYQYDTKGNVTSITDADGQTTTFTYDEHSYLTATTDSAGATTTFSYDSVGNMTSKTDASGNTTTYTYDSFNRLNEITEPDSNANTFTYDLNGNRTSSTDANGNTTYYEYNSKGQITKVTDPLGNITTYAYGGCSTCGDKLTSITDAGGNKTTYEYDLNGRLTKETDTEGNTITYEYDANGNMITKTIPDGTTISYTYDSLNRLTDIIFPDTTQNISYTYDSTGKVLTITDQSGTTEYTYDDSNRLADKIRMVAGVNFTTSYTYTLGGKLSAITYPSGRTIIYSLDDSGRVANVTETKDGNTNDIITGIVYNTSGTVSSIDYANGIRTGKAYNDKGVLSDFNIGTLKQLSYTYDDIGNITKITDLLDSSKTKTFTYDALYRLTNATGKWGSRSYSYDSVGNRSIEISKDGITNYTYSANKLTSSSGVKSHSFSYDANGNTVAESRSLNADRSYIYNQNQRLIKVTDTAVLGEYLYNANGQRVKKTANGKTTYFIYDQSGNLIEEANEKGEVNSDYIYLEDIPVAKVDEWWEGVEAPDAPTGLRVTPGDMQLTVSWNAVTDTVVDGYKVYWGTTSGTYTNYTDVGKTTSYTITGLTNDTTYYIAVTAYADLKNTYFYHTDHLGTPILMTDKEGTVVWEGEFLPFGEEYSITGTVTNNFRFPGQYYDVETGLYQNWHRDYKPEIGRYIEKDPSGIQKGYNHLYVYAGNNPLSSMDISGLDLISLAEGKAIVKDAETWIGVPYLFGGATREGIDYSHLVWTVYKESGFPYLYAKTSGFLSPSRFRRVSSPQEGDIVLFSGHMGIYTGGMIIGAQSDAGKVIKGDISWFGSVRGYYRYDTPANP
jgi:RHS repeat-associated protein